MKLTPDSPAANEAPKPPCAVCGKASRTLEALYWGRHLCDACEAAWYEYVDCLAKVPDDMGAVFQAWGADRKSKARAA